MHETSRRDFLRLGLLATAAAPSLLTAEPPAMGPGAAREAPAAPAANGRYLDAAVKAARFIHSARVESPTGLFWIAGPERPEGFSSSPEVYAGGAGIVLFLLELAHATGDEAYLADASAGADHLAATLPEALEPDAAGLYTGASGIGFALARAYAVTGKEAHHRGAALCRARVEAAAKAAGAGVEWGAMTDIMYGSAGIGLYLLDLAAENPGGDAAATALAARTGRRLIELGMTEGSGRKWKMSRELPTLMPNFSHGTAGVAYFLATLHRATGEPAFLEAALAGARYLLSIADVRGDACLFFHSEPDHRDLYYLGWCHGPVGTSRLFHRLAEVTGDASWEEWVQKGARAIAASGIPESRTPGFWNNVGLCCGTGGVANFFLDLHHRQGRAEDLAFAHRLVDDVLHRAVPTPDGGLKWPHAEHRVKPDYVYAQTGLMQGAAGIGLLLLRFDALEKGKGWTFRLPDSPWSPG